MGNLSVTNENVGGRTITVMVTPTVTTTNSYGTNYVLGGLLTFTAALTRAGSGVIQSVVANFQNIESNSFAFVPFFSNPSNSTFTDAAVAAISTADFSKVAGVVTLAANTQLGSATVAGAYGLGFAINVGATTNLQGVLLANSALTNQFTVATAASISVTILQDI